MDPQLKLLLDEFKLLGDRFDGVETRIDRVESNLVEKFKPIEEALTTLDAWKPQIASAVEALQLEMGVLRKHIDHVIVDTSVDSAGILAPPEMAGQRPPAGDSAIGLHGHRENSDHREHVFGSVATLTHLPVRGTTQSPTPHSTSGFRPMDSFMHSSFSSSHLGPKLPKMNFPEFDGENPKLWQSRCENYFDMFGVDPSMWIKVASMHLKGVAARWLQSVERRVRTATWSQFCEMVHMRFGRDQHELLLRQLFQIRQTHTVQEYIDKFVALVDQLAAYDSIPDPLYYTTRFVDGLKDEIKSIVMVQRPIDLDTACTLAALQEEVGEGHKRRDYRKPEYSAPYRSSVKNTSLMAPPKLPLAEPPLDK
ncbi:uncharacterized protein LOC133901296 [Phragmites australis]|uniref:uncharacterized protein LOC133901296 n=1 Tax=Phragmites australis TaxID=29695 RepID=UPI002D780A1A|nr:uncharacterized protein LOC133901296 [Phragmites australis]